MEAQTIVDRRYNELRLPGCEQVMDAVRQQIADAGLELPADYSLDTSIKLIGHPVTGYPIKKVVLRVIIEADTESRSRHDSAHTIPFQPAFLRRRTQTAASGNPIIAWLPTH